MNSYPTINKPRKYLLENGVYYRDMNETDQIEPHETEHYYYWKYLPSGEWGIKRVAVLKFYNFGDLLTEWNRIPSPYHYWSQEGKNVTDNIPRS